MHAQPTLFRMPEGRRCSLCGAPFGRPSPTCCKCQLRRDPLPPEVPDLAREAQEAASRAVAAARMERLSALGRPVRVALIGCGKTKQPGSHRARQLYSGRLTQRALAYGERTADEAWILSAKHGLVGLDQELEYYDERLPARWKDRAWWGLRVRNALTGAYRALPLHLIVLAGADYANAVLIDPYRTPIPWTYELPLDGLQVGERLSWLTTQLAAAVATPP